VQSDSQRSDGIDQQPRAYICELQKQDGRQGAGEVTSVLVLDEKQQLVAPGQLADASGLGPFLSKCAK
jgi:hypothetical protein